MPNHVHGIIIIDKPENYDGDIANNNGDDAATADTAAIGPIGPVVETGMPCLYNHNDLTYHNNPIPVFVTREKIPFRQCQVPINPL